MWSIENGNIIIPIIADITKIPKYLNISLYFLFFINNITITVATKNAYIAKKYCVRKPNTDVIMSNILVFLLTLYSLFIINRFKYRNAIVKNVSIIYILWNIIVEIPPILNPYNKTANIDIDFLPH